MTWDSWWATFGALSRRQRPGQPVSGEDAKEFFAVLGDISDTEAQRAVDAWTREQARMPKPSELLALVRDHRRAHPAPRGICDVCDGLRFVRLPISIEQIDDARRQVWRNLTALGLEDAEAKAQAANWPVNPTPIMDRCPQCMATKGAAA